MDYMKGNKISSINHIRIPDKQIHIKRLKKHKSRKILNTSKHQKYNEQKFQSLNNSPILSTISSKLSKNNKNNVILLSQTTTPLKSSPISLCSLISLIIGLAAILIVIAVIVTVIITQLLQTNFSKTISVTTTTQTTVTTSSITTETSSTTSSTRTSTTTTFYTCSNFTVTQNWDYPYNDISNRVSQTFASCCEWCLNTTTCNTFILNGQNTCIIKTSKGSGGTPYGNCIGASRY